MKKAGNRITETEVVVNETEFLSNLFNATEAKVDGAETDFPLVDVPANLTNDLYSITNQVQQPVIRYWPKLAGFAASIVMVVIVLHINDQRQTIKQLEQAQQDFATALHYLNEANKITRAEMARTLSSNMQKATIAPVIEIGREIVVPSIQALEQELRNPNRTL